jgi:hypothetical protein
VARFTPNPNRPDDLVASIVALSEQSNRLAVETLMDAARAAERGDATAVVEEVCRLAVAAGVAAGEVAWLVAEIEGAEPVALSEAAAAVAGMQACARAAAHALGRLGNAPEVTSCVEAMHRVADQLRALLPRLAALSG